MKSLSGKLRAVIRDRALRLAGLELKAEYITKAPSAQNSLDLFKGQWASKLPPPFEDLVAGNSDLFNDARIAWMGERIDNIGSTRVLECGPLEGGHTYMMERLGVASIESVEASTQAFLRCLVLKEILQMQRSHFMLGDFVSHLRRGKRYDLVVACGVLYHLVNPIEALALMSKVTDQLYIWTQYYDEQKIKANLVLSRRFQSTTPSEHDGFKHTLYRQIYQTRLGNAGFMGGSESYSNWLTREDLTRGLKFFGFNELEVHFDDADAASGPSISLLARRRR